MVREDMGGERGGGISFKARLVLLNDLGVATIGKIRLAYKNLITHLLVSPEGPS